MKTLQKLPSATPNTPRGSDTPRLLNRILFMVPALLLTTSALAVQEPPFARPAHEEVIPLLRQSLPYGRLQLLPQDLQPVYSAGLSVPTPPLAVPDTIDGFVASPANGIPVTAADYVTLALTVDKPYGCYRSAIDVKTIDAHRHLVTVNLIGANDEPCLAERTQEKVEVGLGRLLPGEHTILIGDGERTHVTLSISVKAAALAE